MGSGKQNWVRAWEHPALSFFSVVFAAVSAHAILWFYSTLDVVHVGGGDFMQPFIKWGLALAFTGFGYLSSRGLAHRLLRGERVGVYFLVCIVLEIVEVATNFMYSAVAIHNVSWLAMFTGGFHDFLLALMYVVLPIVPVVTVVLAWVDMDLTRQKEGPVPFANAGCGRRMHPRKRDRQCHPFSQWQTGHQHGRMLPLPRMPLGIAGCLAWLIVPLQERSKAGLSGRSVIVALLRSKHSLGRPREYGPCCLTLRSTWRRLTSVGGVRVRDAHGH